MLLSAGLGTRLYPITLDRPKALAEVHGVPILEWNLRYLARHGCTECVVNVHHFADKLIDFATSKDFGLKVRISDERDILLETGGGIKKAAPLLQDSSQPIVIMNVDILTDIDLGLLIRFHEEHNALATLSVSDRVSARRLLADADGRLCGWQNTDTGELKLPRHVDAPLPVAFSGLQVVSPAFLGKIPQEGRFSIIDTYLSLCGNEHIQTMSPANFRWIDVGKPESLRRAAELFSLEEMGRY